MNNKDEIIRYLELFIKENNIKSFSPATIQQIADMKDGDLWNLVCNLVEAYFGK